ncbi:MAG: diacylglycerol kinase family protein [Bacteroidales bacterium]|nr:diacylglycerol kinase family protein [Bacteroidales bacterium]
MTTQKFSLKKQVKSFSHAFNGLNSLLRYEHNFRIHLSAALLAIALGVIFKITINEWISLILTIGLVLSLETVNSSIECIADIVSPQFNPKIKMVKDLLAAGVLIGAFTALAIGCIVFVPKIIDLWPNK